MVKRRQKVTGGGFVRRPRMLFAAAIPIGIPLLLAAVTIESAAPPANVAASLVSPDLRYTDLAPPSPADLPEHSFILTFEENDTLDGVLTEGGLSRSESAALNQEFGKYIDLRRLRPGHLVRFHYHSDRTIDSVQMKVSGWGDLEALRSAGGRFSVTPRPASQTSITSDVAATIDTSLYEALRGAGEQPQLVQQLVDVFQWDIDFFSLQKGDSFSLVVEKKFVGGEAFGYGPILAARFTRDGVTYEAFRHQSANGRAGYYARVGTPLRKQFLRAPLKFTRITSGFSKKRFHPILQYFRPHHGVDYGAPVGTPVMTTADGVVTEVGRNRGEGNYIRIRHTSRIDTYYLHLSRFTKGLKRGTKVIQGDVIGYVGSTGFATGPHLDYRVNDGGTWLDPLKLKSITSDPLRSASLVQFKNDVARLHPRLSSAPRESVVQTRTPRRALF